MSSIQVWGPSRSLRSRWYRRKNRPTSRWPMAASGYVLVTHGPRCGPANIVARFPLASSLARGFFGGDSGVRDSIYYVKLKATTWGGGHSPPETRGPLATTPMLAITTLAASIQSGGYAHAAVIPHRCWCWIRRQHAGPSLGRCRSSRSSPPGARGGGRLGWYSGASRGRAGHQTH